MNDPSPPATARPPTVAPPTAPNTVVPTLPMAPAGSAAAVPPSPPPPAAVASTRVAVPPPAVPASLPPAPAPRQLGRFSITRALRKERNSVVYLGLDPVLHREVIIKSVQLPPPSDATAGRDAEIDPLEQAFVRQAQAAGKLSHPHIVTVYEAGRVHETGYLAIERVNGRGLHELIASGWRPQFVHCASIAARIADAIEHAHQQGVAHGHLGPQHVVLQVDGVPKVEGFGGWIDGGATGDDALARTEKLLPYFHSELTDDERRRDVRAVAGLVYMMVTGKAPGPIDSRPAPVASLRADVPPALARLIDDSLAPAAAGSGRRTAGDLRDALTSFIWNERRDNVAPATIGIPLAAPPRRAQPTAVLTDGYAPTVSMTLDGPPAERPGEPAGTSTRPGTVSSARPATLTLRPGTPPPALATELPMAPVQPPSAAERLRGGGDRLMGWVRGNRMMVGGLAGLAVTALAIAAILAATAGPQGVKAPPAAPAVVTAPVPAARGEGVVRLDILPWGEVFVDGKPIGVSPPLDELKLAAGRHTIEVRYGDKAAVSAQIDVDPAKPLQIRHRFDEPR